MARDLNVPVRLAICPIVREADGLAMSSRNRYLDAIQRANATVLHRTIEEIRRRIEAGDLRPAPERLEPGGLEQPVRHHFVPAPSGGLQAGAEHAVEIELLCRRLFEAEAGKLAAQPVDEGAIELKAEIAG